MKKHYVIISIFSLIILFQNCSKVAFNKSADDPTVISQCPGGNCQQPTPTPPPTSQCFGPINIQQPPVSKKLDILFVIDTSGSLDDERSAIANQINQFINALPAETDYTIGVTLAHNKVGTTGRLWRDNSSHPLVLKKSQGISTIQSQLLSRITNQARNTNYEDVTASGGEAGLISIKNMFGNSANLAATKSAGFLRDDAGLALVILSDENDLCVPFRQKAAVVINDNTKDNNHNQIPDYEDSFYSNYCSGTNPTSVYNTIVAARSGKPFLLSSILHMNNNDIPNDANSQDGVGAGYIELVNLAQNQTQINMDTQNIASGLAQIGQAASVILELVESYEILEPITVDPNTVQVRVDGQLLLNSQYSLVNDVIHFDNNAGQANSLIEIRYCGNY